MLLLSLRLNLPLAQSNLYPSEACLQITHSRPRQALKRKQRGSWHLEAESHMEQAVRLRDCPEVSEGLSRAELGKAL